MAAEGGSSEGSSSDSSDDDSMDDLELLLLQNVFCGREFDVHLNFEDISEDDFPSLFRWSLVYLNALHLISRDRHIVTRKNLWNKPIQNSFYLAN